MCSGGKTPGWCWWMKLLTGWPRRHRLERPRGRNLHPQLLPGAQNAKHPQLLLPVQGPREIMRSSLTYLCLKWKILGCLSSNSVLPVVWGWGRAMIHEEPLRKTAMSWPSLLSGKTIPPLSLCSSPLIASLGVLIISDIPLKRSSVFFLSELLCPCCLFWLQRDEISLPPCYQWGINSPDFAVQRLFCHTRFVKLSVPLPGSTTAIQGFFKEAWSSAALRTSHPKMGP